MNAENEMGENIAFTTEEIAAAASIVIGLVRSVAERGNDIEEKCGRCEGTTRWSEAMYDLLAGRWVCPKCWEDGVG